MFFPGKAWYLKDTAKQTRNMHMHTLSNKKTHRPPSKYKILDMLALSAKLLYYKETDFFFSCHIIKHITIIKHK